MNKRMKILQVLFLLIIINEIVTENLDKISDTISDKISDTISDKISDTISDKISETISDKISETISDKQSDTFSDKKSDTISENSDEKERQKKLCDTTQPLKGIKEECFKGNEISYGETCCYMTIKYETNEYFSCVAVKKDKSLIKEKINQIKKDYEGSKSIDIDCKSSFIKIYLISFLFFII